jgi:pimeloyl-ACP methyl ester carboxylesterase
VRATTGKLPEVCIVRGTIVSSPMSTINWAVELPAGTMWNGKTLTIGGGGLDGFIPTDDPWYQNLAGPSQHVFVKISSDSGHQTMFEFAPWALDSVALRNHAYEANHQVLAVGTAIARQFYGKAPTRRYMYGHSNGGRSGLMAANRYPGDYDGIVAMAPGISQQAHQLNGIPNNRWLYGTASAPEANWLSPAKTALFAAAEMRACDALDGVKDGIISRVDACTYVPTDLKCVNDATGVFDNTCLTSGQIQAIANIYADRNGPVTLANNMAGYERYGRGGAATSDWTVYAFGSLFADRNGFNNIAPVLILPVVTGDPNADEMTHDPLAYATQWRDLSLVMEPSPSLTAFAERGGKLLVWHGLSDTCVTVYRTGRFLDEVRKPLGDAKFSSFARHLTSPGIGHELDGPGAGSVDLLSALDAWIEGGVAPDKLVASRVDAAGNVEFQRPLCSFPAYPQYNGSGDPKLASSFSCTKGTPP